MLCWRVTSTHSKSIAPATLATHETLENQYSEYSYRQTGIKNTDDIQPATHYLHPQLQYLGYPLNSSA
jgi:DNA-binding PucR family transcriptional regulator